MIKIKKLKKTNEHIIVNTLLKNKNLDDFLKESNYVCDLDDDSIRLTKIKEYSIFLLIDEKDTILSYLIFQKSNNFNWLMEIMAIIKNKGYAQKLLIYVLKNIVKSLFVDVSLTVDSVKMIEKLINKNEINVKVADLEKEKIYPYDKLNDVKLGMYDTNIQGLEREVLTNDKAKNLVWLLEDILNRRSFPLSQYIEHLRG